MARKLDLRNRVFDGLPFDEALRRWYVDMRWTFAQISAEVGCSRSALVPHFRRTNIASRDHGLKKGFKFNNPARSAKIRFAMKGREITPEWRRKISATRRVRNFSREKSGRWRGGVKRHADGYVMLLKPEHHRANSMGYVMEHILVMEDVLDRPIEPHEQVHHMNGVKDDNRPENLMVFRDGRDHQKWHRYFRRLARNAQ